MIQWDSSWPELAEERERQHLFSQLEDRFGIPRSLFDGYLLFKREKSWSLVSNSSHIVAAAQFKVSMVGIRAFQKVGAYIKPTTRMLQIFGGAATRARIVLDENQLERLLGGERLCMDLDLDRGYVILTLGKHMILGAGFYARGELHSQIPRKELKIRMIRMPLE